MKIGIMGAGYVGLVTGACFSKLGHHVTVFDVDSQKIMKLQMGECTIYEPGLSEIIKSHKMSFCDLVDNQTEEKLVHDCDVIFICVGTPSKPNSEEPELKYVWDAAHFVGSNCKSGCVVVVKSTVPPGTTRKIDAILNEYQGNSYLDRGWAASNPEFLREGSAIADFIRPDRVVFGSDHECARVLLRKLYHDVTRSPGQIIEMTRPESAEMTKLAANGMLAARISYMNEISVLCEKYNADITEVRHGVGSDSRIGTAFLYAGPGYGGSCFPKDVRALSHLHGYPNNMFRSIDDANYEAKERIWHKVVRELGTRFTGKKIAIWGLAFKPDTDDTRESPALSLISKCLTWGAQTVVVDPRAQLPLDLAEKGAQMVAVDEAAPGMSTLSSMYISTCDADLLVLMTEWRQFRNPSFELLKNMKGRTIIDARNVLDREEAAKHGFTVIGVGR